MSIGQSASSPGDAVVRPRHHVENVRRDAVEAAERRAARTGASPSRLITETISWALGEGDHAPFTGTQTPGGAGRADIDAEISACIGFLEQTSWNEKDADVIRRGRHILEILEWLTGAQDKPPTYRQETEPGDLVGGRGRIVRPDAEIRHILGAARAKLAAGQASYALGAGWHQGVIATLEWALGERSESPVLRSARSGQPGGADIAIEQAEAEERTTPPPHETGIPFHFADAVAVTCRWLLGGTTRPPVTGGG